MYGASQWRLAPAHQRNQSIASLKTAGTAFAYSFGHMKSHRASVLPLRRTLTLAALLGTMLVHTQRAAADGVYFSESFGGGSLRVEGDARNYFGLDIALGYRAKQWALEGHWGVLAGDAAAARETAPQTNYTFITGGLRGKYFPVRTAHFDAYVRGGLALAASYSDVYTGRGYQAGVGAQVKARVPVLALLAWPLALIPNTPGPRMTVALFADIGVERYRLHTVDASMDVTARGINFGIALGRDF